jgi:4-hydroxy-tetrahydrodipicolinate synthase
LTEFAKKAGADMALSVVPYYNKPTQEGLYRHFKAIAEAVELPVLLYNVPGRTVADMANDTILRLAEVPGIVGVKDATGNFDRACDLIARAPKDFALYSGDDMSCVSTIMMGFHGNISVTANVAPRLMHEMCVAAAAGNVARAREIQFKLLSLHRDLFCEANPIPVKWAVHKMGLMPNGIRLPLTTLSEANQARVLTAMRQAGVIA